MNSAKNKPANKKNQEEGNSENVVGAQRFIDKHQDDEMTKIHLDILKNLENYCSGLTLEKVKDLLKSHLSEAKGVLTSDFTKIIFLEADLSSDYMMQSHYKIVEDKLKKLYSHTGLFIGTQKTGRQLLLAD
jgi:hypothetical protein